ncbi:MAG: moeZ, partial [Spartobacteria bacterium]|nr:moeZ [Spartobacteria bacterium]
PQCPVCGESPTIRTPIDYDAFCGQMTDGGDGGTPTISVEQLKQKIDSSGSFEILDVREPFEYDIARIEGSRLMPLGEVPSRLEELSREKELIVMCKSGVRSAQAVEFLRTNGFSQVFNLRGGIDAWTEQINPEMARY